MKRFLQSKWVTAIGLSLLMVLCFFVGAGWGAYIITTKVNIVVLCNITDGLVDGYNVSEFSEQDFEDLSIDAYGTYDARLKKAISDGVE